MKNTDLKLGKLHHSILDPNIQQRSLGTKKGTIKAPDTDKQHKDPTK